MLDSQSKSCYTILSEVEEGQRTDGVKAGCPLVPQTLHFVRIPFIWQGVI